MKNMEEVQRRVREDDQGGRTLSHENRLSELGLPTPEKGANFLARLGMDNGS